MSIARNHLSNLGGPIFSEGKVETRDATKWYLGGHILLAERAPRARVAKWEHADERSESAAVPFPVLLRRVSRKPSARSEPLRAITWGKSSGLTPCPPSKAHSLRSHGYPVERPREAPK
jgi:hypothetical protein